MDMGEVRASAALRRTEVAVFVCQHMLKSEKTEILLKGDIGDDTWV